MHDLWMKAGEAREKALKTGLDSDLRLAWAAQVEAERLAMSPAKEYYPKFIKAPGALPRASSEVAEKGRSIMAKRQDKAAGTEGTEAVAAPKTRATGATLIEKRVDTAITAMKKLGASKVDLLSDKQYEEAVKALAKAWADVKATMDVARSPKKAEDKQEQFHFTT
jgi:hypothetical protein